MLELKRKVVKEAITVKKLIRRYIFITLGCLLMALAINCFYLQEHFLSGGTSGLAIILYYLFKWPVGIVSFIMNLPLFYIAYRELGRKFFLTTVAGTIILSFMIDATAFLAAGKYVSNPLLACVAGGMLNGIGCALVYRNDGSTGGLEILGFVINKHYSISVNTFNLVSGLAIMVLAAHFFGLEPVLYSLVLFFISFKFTNLIMVGFDYKKSLIVVSDHADVIAEGVIKEIGRGVTFLYGEGAYTHQKRKIVYAVVKLTQLNKIKTIISDADPLAFVIIQDANDVFGRGFTVPDAKLPPPPEPLKDPVPSLDSEPK